MIGGKSMIAAGIILLIAIGVIIYGVGKSPTGKAISINIYEEETIPTEKKIVNADCSELQCNLRDIKQVCNGGKWVNCDTGEVCSAGRCVIPTAVTKRIVTGGGGRGGGGGGSSGGGYMVSESYNTYDAGEIATEQTSEILKNDYIIFSVGGGDYTLRLSDNTATEASILINSQTYTIKVGEGQWIELNGDGVNDVYIRVSSINIISKKVKIVLRV